MSSPTTPKPMPTNELNNVCSVGRTRIATGGLPALEAYLRTLPPTAETGAAAALKNKNTRANVNHLCDQWHVSRLWLMCVYGPKLTLDVTKELRKVSDRLDASTVYLGLVSVEGRPSKWMPKHIKGVFGKDSEQDAADDAGDATKNGQVHTSNDSLANNDNDNPDAAENNHEVADNGGDKGDNHDAGEDETDDNDDADDTDNEAPDEDNEDDENDEEDEDGEPQSSDDNITVGGEKTGPEPYTTTPCPVEPLQRKLTQRPSLPSALPAENIDDTLTSHAKSSLVTPPAAGRTQTPVLARPLRSSKRPAEDSGIAIETPKSKRACSTARGSSASQILLMHDTDMTLQTDVTIGEENVRMLTVDGEEMSCRMVETLLQVLAPAKSVYVVPSRVVHQCRKIKMDDSWTTLVIPLFDSCHWAICIHDRQSGKTICFEPLALDQCIRMASSRLTQFFAANGIKVPSDLTWTCNSLQQTDAFSCGRLIVVWGLCQLWEVDMANFVFDWIAWSVPFANLFAVYKIDLANHIVGSNTATLSDSISRTAHFRNALQPVMQIMRRATTCIRKQREDRVAVEQDIAVVRTMKTSCSEASARVLSHLDSFIRDYSVELSSYTLLDSVDDAQCFASLEALDIDLKKCSKKLREDLAAEEEALEQEQRLLDARRAKGAEQAKMLATLDEC